jgi:cell division transport system ATP-binding protein
VIFSQYFSRQPEMSIEESAVVDFVNVSAGFPHRPVLRAVNLRVQRGEVAVIEGATGSGKTTLVRTLLGVLPIASGTAHVLGFDLTNLIARNVTALRQKLGVVFQTPLFMEQETVLSNVCVSLMLAGQNTTHWHAEGTRMLVDAGLASAAQRKPYELSGGEQARLQFARALINKPPLMLADEPFADLDAESVTAVQALLAAACERGTAIVITTHGPVEFAGDVRRFRLDNGTLTAAL